MASGGIGRLLQLLPHPLADAGQAPSQLVGHFGHHQDEQPDEEQGGPDDGGEPELIAKVDAGNVSLRSTA